MLTRPLRPDDREPVTALLIDTFGARGDERALLGDWIADPSRVAYVAEHAGGIASFGLASVTDTVDRATYEAPFGAELGARFPMGTVGLWHSLATRPELRGTGAGLAVARGIATALLERGTDTWLGISWNHGPKQTSEPLFRRAGFTELGRARGFYRRFQEETGQLCTRCRPAPCTCEAILFGMAVTPS